MNQPKIEQEATRSQYDDIDALLPSLLNYEKKTVQKEIAVFNEIDNMEEDKIYGMDDMLHRLINATNLSKHQILDEIVVRVDSILEEEGIKELSLDTVKKTISERWKPYNGESAPEFMQRVYGNIRGITRADIRKIDKKLSAAFDVAKTRKKVPEGFSIALKPESQGKVGKLSYHRYVYGIVNSLIANKKL